MKMKAKEIYGSKGVYDYYIILCGYISTSVYLWCHQISLHLGKETKALPGMMG